MHHSSVAHLGRLTVASGLILALLLPLRLLFEPPRALAAGLSDDGSHVTLPMLMASPPLASPAFLSEPPRTAAVGAVYRYAVEASGSPTPALELVFGPDGMSLDGDGQLEWTPASTGEFGVIVRAANGVIPDAEQLFEIIVEEQPVAPVITSSPVVSTVVATDYAYTVVATGSPSPTVFLDEAPDDMDIDETGTIRWSPAAEGTYTVTVRAANGVPPDAVQPFTVHVDPPPPPSAPEITSTPVTDGAVGVGYAYQLQTTGYPPVSSYWFDQKPDGMGISVDGLIQWTPNTGGVFPVTVRARNGILPNAAQSFDLVVTQSPAITSTPIMVATVGEPYVYQTAVSGYPAPELALDIGPEDMTLAADGRLLWTPAEPGIQSVSLRASNGVFPDAEQAFQIEVTPPPAAPEIASAPVISGTAGEPYAYQVQATGYPEPEFAFDKKPDGMTISEDGLISWEPSIAASYEVVLRAYNGIQPEATQSFTIDVALAPRYWDPRLDDRFAVREDAVVESGELYWRLIEAHWFNVAESAGSHHIRVDVRDQAGSRKVHVPILVSWDSGSWTIISEEKPGEPAAADYPMYALAPAYHAWPDDGLPADKVFGMGLGEIDDPYNAHHTSYLLIWQLTVMP